MDENFNDVLSAAEHGDAEAQFKLSSYYIQGKTVEKDTAKAVEWWTKSAEQKNSDAQFNLGLYYYNEHKDYEKAKEYFEKAAIQGLVGAQVYLGLMYTNGNGVAQSYEKAREWYEKAALQRLVKKSCKARKSKSGIDIKRVESKRTHKFSKGIW